MMIIRRRRIMRCTIQNYLYSYSKRYIFFFSYLDVQYNEQKKCIQFLKNEKKSVTGAILILAEINIILARFNISLNLLQIK